MKREKIKKEDGFTLVELLAVVVILGILMGIGIQTYSRYINKTKEEAYDVLVESTRNAMDEYLMDHPFATSVTLEDLYKGDYIERPSDPSDSAQMCEGKVTVTTQSETEKKELDQKEYKINLCCANYTYTYEQSGSAEIKSRDKYCKLYPYDYTQIEDIRVLNVYSNDAYREYVKNWMDEVGNGLIHVTPVSIEEFNKNPDNYLGSNGNWNYDEVIFGFADCYSHKDLSKSSASSMATYLSNGGAAIFGHDTITKGCGNHENFISLQDFINIEATNDLNWTGRTGLTIQKEGVFTEYPYKIGTIGSKLTIKTSHVYGQVAKGDVWITFDDIGTPEKSIYLSTWGNNAFIQTGHTNGLATDDEKKIIANVIFYMVAKQYTND